MTRTDIPLDPKPESYWRDIMHTEIASNNSDKYITNAELADLMGISRKTGWDLWKHYNLPFRPAAVINKTFYYDRAAAMMWLAKYMERKFRRKPMGGDRRSYAYQGERKVPHFAKDRGD